MKMLLQYLGRSETRQLGGGQVLSFAPNLARSRVFWNGELRDPLSFREAISALHEVVVGDLRFKQLNCVVCALGDFDASLGLSEC